MPAQLRALLTRIRSEVEKNCDYVGKDFADEARKIMKVGVWYDTIEETLFNLGLPPNRQDGAKGFLAYDTDGRVPRPSQAPASNPVQIL